MVIKADALHYKTDVYTNVAVLVSLVLVNLTGYEIVDAIVGGCIALFIIYSAFELIKDGVLILLDRAVDDEIVKSIENIIRSTQQVNTYHLLKTREAGNQTFVEVHLVFDCLITLMDAHRTSDKIEEQIKKLDEKRDWLINIHMDPYDDSQINKEK
jgi:cation diffusion facilitator family transporter